MLLLIVLDIRQYSVYHEQVCWFLASTARPESKKQKEKRHSAAHSQPASSTVTHYYTHCYSCCLLLLYSSDAKQTQMKLLTAQTALTCILFCLITSDCQKMVKHIVLVLTNIVQPLVQLEAAGGLLHSQLYIHTYLHTTCRTFVLVLKPSLYHSCVVQKSRSIYVYIIFYIQLYPILSE